MPSSNWTQTAFFGGEWSPYAQGRFDDPRYRQALNVCFNSLPIEAGAWQRRSGTQNIGPSYKASPGCLRPFRLSDGRVMLCEITYTAGESASHLRFWIQPYTGPQFDSSTQAARNYALIPDETADITDISTDDPVIITVDPIQTWATGDVAVLYIDPADGAEQLNNRQVILTRVSGTTYEIADAYTGSDIDGSLINTFTASGTNIAAHVLTLDAPYTVNTLFDLVRVAQSGIEAYFVGGDNIPPYILTVGHIPDSVSATPSITFGEVTFVDGPYDAPLSGTSQTGNDPGTLSATGTTTPTLTTSYSFAATDEDRQIRIWSQPAAYVSASTYSVGNVVTYQGGWWTANNSVPANTFPNGVASDSAGKLYWLLTPQAGQWFYGTITSVTAGVATLAINAGVPAANGTTVDIWQMGTFRASGFHYPTIVRFVQGRIWFAGAAQGRIDASMTGGMVGDEITMSPTDQFGNVNDDNGIAAIFDPGAPFDIMWMLEDRSGILIGSTNGEFALQASALSDPLTPTSIQISKVSNYGSAPVEPMRVGLADVFVQLSRKKLFEYLLDYFSQKYSGRHLNEYAKNLTASNIREIVYTEEKVPAIWVRTGDGNFIGCTYRRDGSLLTQPPVFFGWHRHELGSVRTLTSICSATPATRNAELIDGVAMLTKDADARHTVEVLRPQFDDEDSIEYGWFLDTAIIPNGTDQPSIPAPPGPPACVSDFQWFQASQDAGFGVDANPPCRLDSHGNYYWIDVLSTPNELTITDGATGTVLTTYVAHDIADLIDDWYGSPIVVNTQVPWNSVDFNASPIRNGQYVLAYIRTGRTGAHFDYWWALCEPDASGVLTVLGAIYYNTGVTSPPYVNGLRIYEAYSDSNPLYIGCYAFIGGSEFVVLAIPSIAEFIANTWASGWDGTPLLIRCAAFDPIGNSSDLSNYFMQVTNTSYTQPRGIGFTLPDSGGGINVYQYLNRNFMDGIVHGSLPCPEIKNVIQPSHPFGCIVKISLGNLSYTDLATSGTTRGGVYVTATGDYLIDNASWRDLSGSSVIPFTDEYTYISTDLSGGKDGYSMQVGGVTPHGGSYYVSTYMEGRDDREHNGPDTYNRVRVFSYNPATEVATQKVVGTCVLHTAVEIPNAAHTATADIFQGIDINVSGGTATIDIYPLIYRTTFMTFPV